MFTLNDDELPTDAEINTVYGCLKSRLKLNRADIYCNIEHIREALMQAALERKKRGLGQTVRTRLFLATLAGFSLASSLWIWRDGQPMFNYIFPCVIGVALLFEATRKILK